MTTLGFIGWLTPGNLLLVLEITVVQNIKLAGQDGVLDLSGFFRFFKKSEFVRIAVYPTDI